MPFEIIRGDITQQKVDAIVNAANSTLQGGGGVDGMIHDAAGWGELNATCRPLAPCPVGEARITPGFKLPASYIIHTVGPVYHNGKHGEEELLRACYTNSLNLAAEHGLKSVVFPLISAGIFGYPQAEALRVAVESIRAFLESHDEMDVYLIIYSMKTFSLTEEQQKILVEVMKEADFEKKCCCSYDAMPCAAPALKQQRVLSSVLTDAQSAELDTLLRADRESFSEMLLRLIDEKGMDDVTCYKRADIKRQLFSKIRSNPDYQPEKKTAIQLAFALQLSIEETESLLEKAGLVLSSYKKEDILIRYLIRSKNYDLGNLEVMRFAVNQGQTKF